MTTIGKVKNIKINHEIEWKIFNFSSLSDKNSVGYSSPTFSSCNESWFLEIFPNGINKSSFGYVSLLLFKEKSGSRIRIEFTVGLKKLNRQKYSEDQHEFTFKNINGTGSDKLVLRSELFENKPDLLPDDVITVFCSLKFPTSVEAPEEVSSEKCSLCEKIVDADNLPLHQKKDKPIKCPDCSAVFTLQNWCDHECQTQKTDCVSVTALEEVSNEKCSLCEKIVDADNLSFHRKKDKPIKCPDCSAVFTLQNWFDHECKEEISDCVSVTALSINCSSESSKILQDFKELFFNQEECDVVIKVKDKEFSAHKAVLIARSSVFRSTFRNDMKEKRSGTINIDDCDPTSFSDFLCFLYSGDSENMSDENVFSLFVTSDKYDVQDLKSKCVEFIKNNLSVDTFCDAIILALQYSETELIKSATEFFAKNLQKIIVTVTWQSFAAEYPTWSNELLVKALVTDKNSDA